jgi:hypothetical protein
MKQITNNKGLVTKQDNSWPWQWTSWCNKANVSVCIYYRDASDTVFAGYPAGWISGYSKCRIPDIQ